MNLDKVMSEVRAHPFWVLIASLICVPILTRIMAVVLRAIGISEGITVLALIVIMLAGWVALLVIYYRVTQNNLMSHTFAIVGIVVAVNFVFTLVTTGSLQDAGAVLAGVALYLLIAVWIARSIALKSKPQPQVAAPGVPATNGSTDRNAVAAASTVESLAALRQSTMKWLMGMSAATGVFLVSGVILAVKIDRTSEIALRHSDQVHYELAQWVITLVFMAVFGMYATYKYRRLKSQLVEATSLRIKTIRAELATAVDAGDTQKRIELESELRQLGA